MENRDGTGRQMEHQDGIGHGAQVEHQDCIGTQVEQRDGIGAQVKKNMQRKRKLIKVCSYFCAYITYYAKLHHIQD